MPSLLARVALSALAGSGGHPGRRLQTDASLTPCTHDICGRRTLALPQYTEGSKTPQSAAGFDENGKLMDLKTNDYSQENAGSFGSIVRSGNNLIVSVKFAFANPADHACVLGVEVAHAPGGNSSDATLQHSPNAYQANDPLNGTYTGATTLAQPATSPDCSSGCVNANYTNTMSVTIPPSSYPHRYEDNFGAKLHVGRLGITVKPYLLCNGLSTATSQKNQKVYLEQLFIDGNDETGVTAHPIYYDLVAKGDTLTSKDEAGAISGQLKTAEGQTAKRLYDYTAAFVHFHDQVRFPETSVAGKAYEDHFDSPSASLQSAVCVWDQGELHNDLTSDRANLESNGWMTPDDSVAPEEAYGAWSADECANGVCKKFRKDTTVASTTAYLPFDKPLTSYYKTDKAPKVTCKSQKDTNGVTPEGTPALSESVPDLANDDADAIFSDIVTSFNTVTAVVCTKEGTTDICDTSGVDTMTVKGQIFNFTRVIQDFTDLLQDQYDFRATYSCQSDRAADATPADACVIQNGTDTTVEKLTTLKRTDSGNDLKAQLEAKAVAVEDIQFSVPTKYGTTFDQFKLTLSGESEAASTHKYRATGDFRVNIQLLDSDSATVGDESVQWTGGDEIAIKEFEGYTTTDRFVKRQPAINTQIRVKSAAVTGYYVENAVFAATTVGNDTFGIMSPFVTIADIADTGATGADDDVSQAMSSSNKYTAVKSYCCGRDSASVDGSTVDCTALNAAGSTTSTGASVYCRTNGFDAVRCLSSTLSVQYTVKTQSLDHRFDEFEVVATKTYTAAATPSLSQADQNFVVQNAEFNAQTVGAGEQAGADTFSYNIATDFMGSARDDFTRDKPSDEDKTYNCETAGRTVTYRTTLPTPCGESDRNEMSAYALEAYVTAHFVYTKGTNGSPNQVSQNTATATIAGKTDRAYAAILKDNGQHWETEEWRVQDSSSETSDAKGSGTPIELKVVISNDNSVTDYDADLHMPASKVFIDSETLSVTAGPGNVTLKECTTDSGETYCILEYTNNDVMSIDAGKYCGDQDQPACPVISYKIAARVLDGAHADGFGHTAACGVQAEEVPLTYIGDQRSHTLFVWGNERAYDGVLDIHVVEKDDDCQNYCRKAFGDNYNNQECYDSVQFPDNYDNAGWKRPELNEGQTYCRNPYPIAEEDIHNVAVPGRDGAAQTNLQANVLGALQTSKDLTFEVRYFQIGNGPRKFTIDGLNENIPPGLPAPLVCSSTAYEEGLGCVRPEFTVDDADASTQSLSINGCLDGSDNCAETEAQMKISSFYLALGSDKTLDVCSNTNVGSDPYTIKNDDGTETLTLGFSIKVEYLSDTATGDPDSDVEHKFYFQLQCPQKAYSMNLVQFGGDASAPRKNIPAGVDIGLVDKNLYAESHYKFMKVLGYFAGRSTDRYDPNNGNVKCAAGASGCRKASVRMVPNDFVQFKDGAQEIFLDTADDFDNKAEIEFEFKQACLFTTITLISKTTPFDENGNFITGTEGDTQFSFRVQCPRWRDDASTDSLILHYDVDSTTFDGSGGSVTVKQPLINGDMINEFTSITTSLKGDLCQGGLASATCTFDGTTAPGNTATLEKTTTQQEWLDYLKDDCGFTLNEESGNYIGFMERVYQRKNLDFDANQGTQTYCSGRKLSFGIETQGTHTATIRVDAPLEMDFAVQIDQLKWQECAGENEYQLVAQATLYRRQFTTVQSNQPWYKATETQFTDIVSNDKFFPAGSSNPTITVDNGVMTITGQCQVVDDSGGAGDNCAAFEEEREVDFGVVYTRFGVDYRASLGIDMQMSCPRGTKSGSDAAGVPLRHTTDCSDYGQNSMSTCPIDNSDNLYYVGAQGQIRLTLMIDDTSFEDHVVSKPTYQVTAGTLADVDQSGFVEDLCDASEVDCMFRANDGSGDIALVTARNYPDDPVVINGVTKDWSNRAPEENSVITLRALPLSDTTIKITWVVDRVLESTGERRRLRVGYELGAAQSNTGEDGVAFKVLPATREEDAGIAVSETEEAAEETTHQTSASHAETDKKKEEEGTSMLATLLIVFGVLAAGVLFLMLVKRRGDEKKKEGAPEVGVMKSRFYQYSRLSKGEDKHMEDLWKRNRFNTESNSRFL